MNLVFTINNEFSQHLAVVLESIKKTNSNENISCFVITEYISDVNKKKVLWTIRNSNIELSFIQIDLSGLVEKLKVDKHASTANYYRLFLTDWLPKELKKIIYLDTDLLVLHSLKPLWEMDVSTYAMAGVHINNQERIKSLDLHRYYNSGVLLINLEYWREHNLKKRFIEFLDRNEHLIKFWDQDVLNYCFKDCIKSIDRSWNYCNIFSKKEKINILHFAGMHKPWSIHYKKNFNSKMYYQYLFCTKYWRPRYLWKLIYSM